MLHGVSVNDLIKHGLSITDAAQRLSSQLAGQKVYTDCPPHKHTRIQRLFSAANARMVLRVGDVFDLIEHEYYELFGLLQQQKRQHRALPDCYAIDRLPYNAHIAPPTHKVLSNVS